MDLSVIVPCHDEAGRIPPALEALESWLIERPHLEAEVVVVDDGSRDQTSWVARAVPLRRLHRTVVDSDPLCPRRNRGKGAALRRGAAVARGRWLVTMDADVSVSLTFLDPLLDALRAGADVAVGSRTRPGARILRCQPWHRRLLGALYRRLARFLLRLTVEDLTCGFKAFRGGVARELLAASGATRWGIDAEVLTRAERRGLRVVEIPIHWRHGEKSAVRLWRDVPMSLASLLATAWRTRRRKAPALVGDLLPEPQQIES